MEVKPLAGSPSGEDCYYDTITRVSVPWPARTQSAMLMSLDHGTFEDICITISPGPESAGQLMHFAGAVDVQVGSAISQCKPSYYHKTKLMVDNGLLVCQESTSQSNLEISLLTFVANVHNYVSASEIYQLAGHFVLYVH